MKAQFCLVLSIAHGGHYIHSFLPQEGLAFIWFLLAMRFFGFSFTFPFVFNVIVWAIGFY
jgi:hypothetical protein